MLAARYALNLPDYFFFDEQVEVRLVWVDSLAPAAVLSDEEHQKCGTLIAIGISVGCSLHIREVAHLLAWVFWELDSDSSDEFGQVRDGVMSATYFVS